MVLRRSASPGSKLRACLTSTLRPLATCTSRGTASRAEEFEALDSYEQAFVFDYGMTRAKYDALPPDQQAAVSEAVRLKEQAEMFFEDNPQRVGMTPEEGHHNAALLRREADELLRPVRVLALRPLVRRPGRSSPGRSWAACSGSPHESPNSRARPIRRRRP